MIIDLREVRSYDDAGYQRLIAAQRELAASNRRTAYIVSRPRIRALVFKVVHITEDKRARPVASDKSARAWLAQRGSVSYAAGSLERAMDLLKRLQRHDVGREANKRGGHG